MSQVSNSIVDVSIATKGKSHHLLKKAMSKKKRQLFENSQKELTIQARSVAGLKNEIEDLKQEIMEREAELKRSEADRIILSDLFSKGIIDEHGNLL